MKIFTWWRCVFVALLPLVLGACGGAQMMKAEQEPVIKQGESMVVFMRSSLFGGAIAASVFIERAGQVYRRHQQRHEDRVR
jgi:hypothetical protein